MIDKNKLFCPFCINSWICDGPHLSSENDMINFLTYCDYSKQDYLVKALEEIKKYSEQSGIDLQELSDKVKEKIEKMER